MSKESNYLKNLYRHNDVVHILKGQKPMTNTYLFSRGYLTAHNVIIDNKEISKKEKKQFITKISKEASQNEAFAKGYMAAIADYKKHQRTKGLTIFGEKIKR